MAIQEERALADRVYGLLGGLASVDATEPVGPGTELKSIGFDSLAAAELAGSIERDLGIDLVDCRLAGLRTAGELAELAERTVEAARPSRQAYPAGMGRLQSFAKTLVGPFCRWWFSMEVAGTEHMPRSGPVVLCMNHESLLDIPLSVVAS